MKKCVGLALAALMLLTGCASVLEREHIAVEPHSSKFWESEAAGTLRAENYQDIVNDLLLLIGQHTESATLRLYNMEDDLSVAETMDRATYEIRQETPVGAYAVEYITCSSQAQRGYYEVSVQISYRRTAEQLQSMVNATSTEALYRLLGDAVENGKTELAVRIGYWTPESHVQAEDTVRRLREERELTEAPPWLIFYYPENGEVGLVEFVLDPTEEQLELAALQMEQEAEEQLGEGEGGEDPENPDGTENPGEAESGEGAENAAVPVESESAESAGLSDGTEEKEKNIKENA